MRLILKYILIFINIALYLTTFATWISIPDSLTLNFSLALCSLSMTFLLLFQQRERILHYWKGPFFTSLLTTLFSIALIFSILGLVNYLGVKHPRQWDLTKDQLNSLSEQTHKILQEAKEEISFKIFVRRQDQRQILAFLDLYRNIYPKIQMEVIDPELRPDLVKHYDVQKYGTIIVEYGERKWPILEQTELDISRGILRVLRPNPVLCFIQNHGEPHLEDTSDEGLSYLADLLKKSYYDVLPLENLHQEKIPEQCHLVVLWGPKSPLHSGEMEHLSDYLQAQGKFLLALDPNPNGEETNQLADLIKPFGIDLPNSFVIDQKSFVSKSQGTAPIIQSYDKDHPITRNFKAETFFPLARPVQIIEEKKGEFNLHELMSTSDFPDSWAEHDLAQVLNQTYEFNEGADTPGPVPLALASERKDGQGKDGQRKNKVIVVGTSRFVLNSFRTFGNQFHFIQNAIAWLVDDDFIIANSRPHGDNNPVLMSGPQLGLIFYFSVVFCPLILFGLAIFLYKRRQKL